MDRRAWLMMFGCVTVLGPIAQAQTNAPAHRLTLWHPGSPGTRMAFRGKVVDKEGKPLEGANVTLRHANPEGIYTDEHRGSMVTDRRGRYELRSVVPGDYGFGPHIHMDIEHPSYPPVSPTARIRTNVQPGTTGYYGDVILELTRLGDDVVMVGDYDIMLGR